jgi:membrane protease YdiL (CAAX protease family)
MKRFLFGVLWLLAIMVAAGAAVGHLLPRGVPALGIVVPGAPLGAVGGVLLFLFLAGVNVLPGARLRRGDPVPWAWPQAAWMVVQFFTVQVSAQIAFMMVIYLARAAATRLGHPVAPLSFYDNGPVLADLIVFATAVGYLAAGLWSIAWRAAPTQAYLAAIGCLLVVGVAGALVQHVLPPGKAAAHGGLVEQIFGTHGWKVAALFVLAAVVAPFLEEFVFRGGMIAALTPRFGVFWAAALTSLVFTACHAQETWAYHPGLLVILVIAVLLAWLRIRYQSIRPGILLHVLFNGISVLALAVSG